MTCSALRALARRADADAARARALATLRARFVRTPPHDLQPTPRMAQQLLRGTREVSAMEMEIETESVSDVMSQPVVVIGPDWAVSEVFAQAERRHIHHFPIVEAGSLVGFVCTCDLRDAEPGQAVLAYARRNTTTIAPTRSVADAARLMAERAVGSAVVVGPEGIRGIVTREDLQDRAEAEALLGEGHCAACSSVKHLRGGPDGAFLCIECSERAHGDNWFETGLGD
jgi:CBS domain-containing protein